MFRDQNGTHKDKIGTRLDVWSQFKIGILIEWVIASLTHTSHGHLIWCE